MKLAMIGTGNIVTQALGAIAVVDEIEISAIYGRPHSKDKALSLAQNYNIPEVYTDYEELLARTAADTVYIGLVNNAHYSYTKKALLAGKNVILEKPFTMFCSEALELKEIAEEKGLFLFEAITVLHNDVFAKMQENLHKLGRIRMVMCNYSQYSSRYDAYLQGRILPAFDPKAYAGALCDINVYNIHYCAALFGNPKTSVYHANFGYNGVDISGTLIMEYDGFQAVCTGAKDSDSPGFVSIQGERGYMRFDGKPNAPTELTIVYVDENNHELVRDASGAKVRAYIREHYEAPLQHHRMTQEFRDFARIIKDKDYDTASKLIEETISVVDILEKARS